MGKPLVFGLSLVVGLCLRAEGLRLSIFAQHVEEIARQEKLPLAEAAAKVKALGYDGVVITTEMTDETVKVFRQAGFEIPCVIGWPKFEQGANATYCAETLAKAKFAGAKRIMLVPGFYTNDVDRAAQFDTIVSRTRASVSVGSGCVPMAEIIAAARAGDDAGDWYGRPKGSLGRHDD